MAGQQGRMVRAQAIAVPLSVLLNVVLIPRLGMTGAAIASAVTTASMNLLWLWDVKNKLNLLPSGRGYFCLLLPTGITIAVLAVLRSLFRSGVPGFAVVLLGLGASYAAFGLSALRFALEPQDKALMAGAVTRIRGMFSAS